MSLDVSSAVQPTERVIHASGMIGGSPLTPFFHSLCYGVPSQAYYSKTTQEGDPMALGSPDPETGEDVSAGCAVRAADPGHSRPPYGTLVVPSAPHSDPPAT